MRVQLLLIEDEHDAAAAFEELGVHPEGVRIMSSKAAHRLLKVRDLDARAANILKQEMLARGGDAAVPWNIYSLKAECSDAIVMGTLRQLYDLAEKLLRQPLGLADIGREIKETLDAAEAGPSAIELPNGRRLDFGQRAHIMGVLNVTPDSFSDGGTYLDTAAAVDRALEMAEEGADIIDVGGESTRPGSEPLPVEEELRRVLPVIESVARQTDRPISVDTHKPEVAEAALDAGATIVNDVYGLRDEHLVEVVARRQVPAIIMHMRGTPADMQENPVYRDLMGEIASFLDERIEAAVSAGCARANLLVDPGIGFGKTVGHNLSIIRRLPELKAFGCPIAIGVSRKSFIGAVLDTPVTARLEGTAAVVALSVARGANVLRVHDVAFMARVVRMTEAVLKGEWEGVKD